MISSQATCSSMATALFASAIWIGTRLRRLRITFLHHHLLPPMMKQMPRGEGLALAAASMATTEPMCSPLYHHGNHHQRQLVRRSLTTTATAATTTAAAATPLGIRTLSFTRSDLHVQLYKTDIKGKQKRLNFPGGPLTGYVATRWYRAPEVMLCFREGYGAEMDMWSVGCILAELIAGAPIFGGKDYVDQIARINNVLGSPSEAVLDKIGSERARTYIKSLPNMPAVPLEKLYPNAQSRSSRPCSQALDMGSRSAIDCRRSFDAPLAQSLPRVECTMAASSAL